MKTLNEINNLRQIKVKFLAPTNTRGARLKIYEPKRYNDDREQSKVFSFDYYFGCIQKQSFDILTKNGFNVICKASEHENYIFLCDNWGEDFKKISKLKE